MLEHSLDETTSDFNLSNFSFLLDDKHVSEMVNKDEPRAFTTTTPSNDEAQNGSFSVAVSEDGTTSNFDGLDASERTIALRRQILGNAGIDMLWSPSAEDPQDITENEGGNAVQSEPSLQTTTLASSNSNFVPSTATTIFPATVLDPLPLGHSDSSSARVNQVQPEKLEDLPDTTSCKDVKFPPLRPLTPYNFFFRDERDRILTEREDDTELNEPRRLKLLWDHWGRDRTQKRPHRKSHGKISFAQLSRRIAARWRTLSANEKQFYRDLSSVDHKRFKRETQQVVHQV